MAAENTSFVGLHQTASLALSPFPSLFPPVSRIGMRRDGMAGMKTGSWAGDEGFVVSLYYLWRVI